MPVVRAYVGLGANLGEPEAQVRRALDALGAIRGTRLLRASSLWHSAPLGYADQPEFINAVAEIETTLAPRELLDALLEIEARFGRVRTFQNAPRTLDLDILLYGDRAVAEPGLAVPHPRMHERAFVLAPLAEIAPDTVIPGRGAISTLLAGCGSQSVQKANAR